MWERAKAPERARYCDLVAGAVSKLAGAATMANAALDLARHADALLPGHAAPLILEGRALEALGQDRTALATFREGKRRDPSALDDPPALLAWARVLAHTGHTGEALAAYRGLLPRMASLPGRERASAYVEAGLVAMASGPPGLDDAVADLRQAARDDQAGTRALAVYGLALALARRGEPGAAQFLLSDRTALGNPVEALSTDAAKRRLSAAPAETFAIEGFALEARDRAASRDAWVRYTNAAPTGPWAAATRRRLGESPRVKGRAP
ncbi:MAG: hypothetical protein ACREJ3_06480 [Polyangiaceae bacterium]